MTLHHSKHHQTYITNLNTALGTLHKSQHDIPTQIALQSAMKFNGGGHINHSLFWANLAPASSPNTKIESAAPKLAKAISAQWGSHGAFQAEFEKMLLGIQGSGWGWLIKTRAGMGAEGLVMMTTRDQDSVVEEGKVPLLGVDMWEHAYYLWVFLVFFECKMEEKERADVKHTGNTSTARRRTWRRSGMWLIGKSWKRDFWDRRQMCSRRWRQRCRMIVRAQP